MFIPSNHTAVLEPSQVGHARRTAVEHARGLGFSATELGAIGVIVTEAANNLVKHARNGMLLFRTLDGDQGLGFEILVLDSGPGMADVARCLEDGYSTAGSPGTGLGAIVRTASLFDIFSEPGSGTVMVAQVWTPGYRASYERSTLEIGAVSVPIAHETVSGDGWSLTGEPARPRLMVVDGLGHGESAAQAAREALRIFEQSVNAELTDLVHRAQRALAPTRGAALAVLEFEVSRRQVTFIGIGNISGRVWDSTTERNFVSVHGIVGQELRPARVYHYPWPQDASVVMATDGLLTRWTLDPYPGLRLRHPSLLAGVLYRDFQRGNDDVTVVAVRER